VEPAALRPRHRPPDGLNDRRPILATALTRRYRTIDVAAAVYLHGKADGPHCHLRRGLSEISSRVVPRPSLACPANPVPVAKDRSAEGASDRRTGTLGPHWVRVATVQHRHQRSPTVQKHTGHRPSGSSNWDDPGGRISLWSQEGQRSAPSGSRRAATGVRNNRRVCLETVEDHDRRFWFDGR
jgi:hypothetical protein